MIVLLILRPSVCGAHDTYSQLETLWMTAKGLLTSLNKMPPTLAVKLKLNKEILNKAPAAVPDFKSEREDTKITESKLEEQSAQLKVPKNMEKVMVPRTMSPAAPLPTPNSRRAATGESSVHTTQRSTEVIETEAKTIGFMDVTTVSD